jgi:hypothetical protein
MDATSYSGVRAPGPAPRSEPARRRPVLPGWGWAIVAALATVLAVVGRTSLPLTVAAATLAVVSAGLTLAAALGPRAKSREVMTDLAPVPPDAIRDAFRAGTLGREDLVFLLDRLERTSLRPTLPVRQVDDVRTIVDAPEEEFLRYLEGRIGDFEGSL